MADNNKQKYCWKYITDPTDLIKNKERILSFDHLTKIIDSKTCLR